MSVLDWPLKRGITQMMTVYAESRRSGVPHFGALERMVRAWYGKSQEKAEEFLYRYSRTSDNFSYVSACDTKETSEMKTMISMVLQNDRGEPDDKVMTWITEQTEKVYQEINTKYGTGWH
jgi:hypothetical protein